ncbi:MAG: DUF2079 domain-containing protein [bacterium]
MKKKNRRLKDKKGFWIIILGNLLLIFGFFLYKSISFSTWKVFFLIFLVSSFVFLNVQLLNLNKDIPKSISFLILFLLTSLCIAIYSWLSIIQYNGFLTGHYDLARFDQAIWNILQGRIISKTLHSEEYIIGQDILSYHFSPTLLILVPFYYLWQDPRMLLFLQSLFLGLGAIPVFLIAKDKLKHNLLSLSFSFAYLFHPFLSRVALFEFHEICLAPFFLLFTFYFLQKRKWVFYFIFLLFSLMIKEDVSLIITALGIYSFFKINKKIGIITFIIGILWAYSIVSIVIPYFKKITEIETSTETYKYFGRLGLGESPGEIIKNLILKPQNTLKILFSPFNEKLTTIILFILPCCFLSILSFEILIALPEIALHFMAGWDAQYLLFFQYSAPIFPWAIVSAIYGCSLIKRLNPIILSLLILSTSLIANYYFGMEAFNPSFSLYGAKDKTLLSIPYKNLGRYYQLKRERALFKTLTSIIPKDISLSVQDNLVAHFSQRRAPLYYFPDYKNAKYVILNTYCTDIWVALWGGVPNAEKILKDNRFQLLFRNNVTGGTGIFLFAKKEGKDGIIRDAERLVKENPNKTYTHFILGSIYFHTNNHKEAENEFEIALGIDKENPFAKEMLEQCKKFVVDKKLSQ